MTKSINKARNGFVKISLNSEEKWVNPEDIKINNLSLKELFEFIDNKLKLLNETVANQNNEIAKLKEELKIALNEFQFARGEVKVLRKNNRTNY